MENLQTFCDNWLAAWTGNNSEKLMTYYTEDAFYSDPAKRSGLNGHEELLPYFSKLLGMNPAWKWKALEIMVTAKGFTLKWEASIPVGNRVVIEQGVDIVELRGEKICRNEVYFDRTAWARTMEINSFVPFKKNES